MADERHAGGAGGPGAVARALGWAALAAGLAAAGLGVGLCALHVHHRRLLDLGGLEDAVAAQIDHTRALRERASQNPADLLAALPANRAVGPFVRLDERLADARLLGNAASPPPPERPIGFEFDGADPVPLLPVHGEHEITDGTLSLVFEEGDYLLTQGRFDSGGERIDEIEIRIRLERGSNFTIGWSRRREKVWDPADKKMRLLRIAVVPDGKFHVYRVNAEQVMKLRPGQHARSLLLVPSDVAGDRVTIDYLRLVRKRDRYASHPVGRSYEMIGNELRAVLHARAPLTLAWDVEIPEREPRLDLGMGLLEPGALHFSAALVIEGEEVPLLGRDVSDADRWRDARIDLARFAGRRAELRLRVDGEPGRIAFWSSPIVSGAPPEPVHVVLLLQDALRADHLSGYGYARPTSPAHDALAAEGVVFEHAFSQATKTRASVPSFMTSLHATATGVWNSYHHLGDRYLTLAEVLRSQGFVTASFIQNLNAGPESGMHQGFDFLMRPTGAKHPADVFPAVLRWIAEHRDRSFFLYLHVLDPHGAYDPPEGFDGWYREEKGKGEPVARDGRMDPPWVAEPTAPGRIARYDGEIASDDHWIGALRDQLRSTGIDDTTLLAMIADHGEHLGEHGLWEHHPPGFQQVLHVPMVLRFPKHLPAGVRVSEPVGLIDLAPTLLELVGVDPTALPFQGRSLVARARGEEAGSHLVVSEEVISYQRDAPERVRASLFFRGWHLLRSRVHGEKSVWAFRYAEDAEEVRPLPTLRFDPLMRWRVLTLLRQLKNANLSLWAEMSREAGSEDVRLDPETQDQLRALGYID